jgi:hypothetical protein
MNGITQVKTRLTVCLCFFATPGAGDFPKGTVAAFDFGVAISKASRSFLKSWTINGFCGEKKKKEGED